MTARQPDLDSPARVLAGLRADRAAADAAGVRILVAATDWIDLHPAWVEHDRAWPTLAGADQSTAEFGTDLPAPTWTSVPDFAVALGLSTGQGQDLLLEAMHARHRLPRVWAQMLAGKVTDWRVRRIAKATLGKAAGVAEYVDTHVAPIAGTVGLVTLDKLINEAMMRLHPTEWEADQHARLDERFVKLFDHISHNGVAELQIRAELSDALHFDAAIATIAARLAEEDDNDPLQVRRSKAIGILADPDLAPHYLRAQPTQPGAPDDSPAPTKMPARKPREIILNIHLSEAAVTGTTSGGSGDPVGRMEQGDRPVLTEQVRAWCGNPDAHITVRPVRDLTEHLHVGQYEASDRLTGLVEGINHTCVFPWCPRPARACDKDHTLNYADGGATCSCNLAPLCRRHHRIKTTTAWTYAPLDPTTYLWTSPLGQQLLRDETGTRDVTPPGSVTPPPGDDPSGGPPGDNSPGPTGCTFTDAA